MNILQEPQIITQAYKDGKQVFVLAYMNGCPYCEPIIPIWNKIDTDIRQNPKYKVLNSKIKITKIERTNLDKVKDHIKDIDSFPTFVHMAQGKTTTIHNPDRNYKDLIAWIMKLSQQHSPSRSYKRSRTHSYKRYAKGGRKNKKRTRRR